eukprot:3451226-Ditylum_brightwellii.AAC.1
MMGVKPMPSKPDVPGAKTAHKTQDEFIAAVAKAVGKALNNKGRGNNNNGGSGGGGNSSTGNTRGGVRNRKNRRGNGKNNNNNIQNKGDQTTKDFGYCN